VKTDSFVYHKRLEAAIASRGISSEPVYEMAIRNLDRLVPHGKMLEFGAGSGQFSRLIVENWPHVELVCADIQKRPDGLPEKIIWNESDLNLRLQIEDNTFDFIVSTEVIEHLENPRAVFREFYRLLKPGGKVLLTTPNQESIRSFAALVFGGHFAAFRGRSYPAHITALLRKDIERICSECGFDLLCFDFSNNGGLPGRPGILWQRLLPWLGGRLFSDNLAVICEKLSK
jgi:2-polyprenyl-3-methyl-5-hydroxy-6-metoxy-1,4-benzoquinol methylase